jgi:hypothetical protein
LIKKFVALGTECAEYLKVSRASEGELLFLPLLILYAFLCLLLDLSFPPCCPAAALVTANALIFSLEAELSASRKAFDAATAAKVNAEKSNKSALAKANKAEKALSDANKEHLQREQAVDERLNTMSAAAGGTHCTFLLPLLFDLLAFLYLLIYSSSAIFCILGSEEYTRVPMSTLQPDSDPLMAAVSLLEANWKSIQDIFELVNRVLTRIFVGLWPKQKVEVPHNDVKKLAQDFDTTDNPLLQMKGLSLKRGAEGAIAFSYAHGVEVNWEKVGSSHGHTRSELKAFFEKAKKFSPAILAMISPSAASATSSTLASSTPATNESTPPMTAGAFSAMPSSAMEHDAEVA